MISYQEYQEYERLGFDERLRREYRWNNTNCIVNRFKYNETSLDEILKGVELINIIFNEPEEDENVDEDGNEILCFEDSKCVSFKLRTNIKFICEKVRKSRML